MKTTVKINFANDISKSNNTFLTCDSSIVVIWMCEYKDRQLERIKLPPPPQSRYSLLFKYFTGHYLSLRVISIVLCTDM